MSLPGAARACALLAVVAMLLAACGSDEPTATPSTTTAAAATSTTVDGAISTTAPSTTTSASVHTIEVTYANGQVVGGVRTETVRLGEKVRLRVTSDVAEEVHVHTYDVMADVAAGQTAEIELTATIPGRHEVELEKKGKQLLELEVK